MEYLTEVVEYLPLVPLAGAYVYLIYKIGDFARESEESNKRNEDSVALEKCLETEEIVD